MPIYNLIEIVHDIWLQRSRNHDTCLYTLMSYDYVRAFKQSTLYGQYLQGGLVGHGLIGIVVEEGPTIQ